MSDVTVNDILVADAVRKIAGGILDKADNISKLIVVWMEKDGTDICTNAVGLATSVEEVGFLDFAKDARKKA